MKKKLQCLRILIILCLVSLIAIFYNRKTQAELSIDKNSNLILTVNSADGRKVIYPYENPLDGKSYFFLPSYTHERTIHIKWSDNSKISVDNSVVFMRSENIPAVFIETDSGSMEYLHSDKNNMESGLISIIEANGNIEYAGVLERISGRGNTSWEAAKKPYVIKLKTAKALLGMDAGKRWYLLPIWREGSRMNTKVAFDIAAELGLAYTPQCTWIDLYLNGEYNGNYLLCESMTVEDGRIEIDNLEKENKINNPDIESAVAFTEESYKGYELENGGNTNGGYLIEKDNPAYYQAEPSGFITTSGNCFSLKSPSYASREQVKYIKDYFQKIEDMIAGGNPDYEHYIDLKSFSARFLVDEITLDFDANVTSMFFYKNKDSDLLYAGPVWDYDSSMGWGKVGPFSDYEESTLNDIRDDDLKWYQLLYFLNEEFYQQVVADYERLLPYFETLLTSTIDEYADTVRASSLMDEVRWQSDSDEMRGGHYAEFDNNVRYLKFFLAKRLNYLCEKWQIPYQEFATESNGLQHTVTFICDNNIIETKYVTDADMITELPYLDESLYDGWYYGALKYNGKIPIYEDCTLCAGNK